MITSVIARVLSIVGHPAVVVPGTILWLSSRRAAQTEQAVAAGLAAVTVAVVVVVWCLVQVRAGRWSHVDASKPDERRLLNRGLLGLLGLAALGLSTVEQSATLVAGAALSAAIVATAVASERWIKLSLHTAFAVFAVALVWPEAGTTTTLAVLTLAIAWSRLSLGRHALVDVVSGAFAGAIAGVALRTLPTLPTLS